MTAPADQSAPADTEEGQQTDTTEQQDGAQGGESGSDALGDKGKQALDRMKTERNQYRQQLAEFKALGLDPAKLKELIGKSEQDAQAAEQERVRREAETAALSKANERLVRAEIKAAAAGKLANPARAAELLASLGGVDLSSFDVDDDGNVDSDAISTALDDLLTKEPYLAAAQGDSKRFQGSADGGPRGEPAKSQLTRAQVERMAKDGKHAEIEQARLEGRLNNILGIT